jgi:hypothetical protein
LLGTFEHALCTGIDALDMQHALITHVFMPSERRPKESSEKRKSSCLRQHNLLFSSRIANLLCGGSIGVPKHRQAGHCDDRCGTSPLGAVGQNALAYFNQKAKIT